ncbi:hypothetical protein [Thalassospira xiamenensis]|uniref:hypothetical protein n=1 Tax=Thalassospira xiamenensis TaxID=220697 RepID=UPI000DEDDA5A|nr:hypothetical protein [Thalassospira xiamenensis]RCK34591.1 hypothetical protein TH24_20565 [Thalassospira xiamenensis]
MFGIVTLPCGIQFDPLRPLQNHIEITDIAKNLAEMPVYVGPLTLEISVGQTALHAVSIFHHFSKSGDPRVIRYLLLEAAWQYVFKGVTVPIAQVLEPGYLDQLKRVRDLLSDKVLRRFDSLPDDLASERDNAEKAIAASHYLNLYRFARFPEASLPPGAQPALAVLRELDLLDSSLTIMAPDLVAEKYLEYFPPWASRKLA